MGLGNGFGSMMLSRGRKSKSVVSCQWSVGRAADGSPRVCVLCGIYGLDGTAVRDAHAVWVCVLWVCGPLTPVPSPPFHGGEGRNSGERAVWLTRGREAAK